MRCPHCQSESVVKNVTCRLQDDRIVQYYRGRGGTHNFNERTRTPMARLRTPSTVVQYALNSRSEGMRVRATGNKSQATVLRWQQRLAHQRWVTG